MVLRAGADPLRADRLGRRVRADRRGAATRLDSPGRGRLLHLRAAPATRPPSCTSCSSARSAPTTCPTAPTCATSRPARRSTETIGIGKGTRHARRLPPGRADRRRRPEPGHQPPADAHRAGEGQAQRREDHRGQPAARGRADRASRTRRRPRAWSAAAPRWPTCFLQIRIGGDLALFQAHRRSLLRRARAAVDHDFIDAAHRRLRRRTPSTCADARLGRGRSPRPA